MKHTKKTNFLNSLLKPFFEEFVFIFIFMKAMGLTSINNLIVERFNAVENIAKFPSYLNLFGRIAILFLFAYLAATAITKVKRVKIKWALKSFLYLTVILLFATKYFVLSNFGLEITPTFFVLIAETTKTESQEFINQYILSAAIIPTLKILAYYICTIIVAEVCWNIKIKSWTKKIPLYATRFISICIATILIFGIYSTNIYWKVYNADSPDKIRFIQPPTDPLSSIYTSLMTIRLMRVNLESAIEINKATYNTEDAYITKNDSLNIVVVIGESYIKWHSQLYGYKLQTTPYMDEELQAGRLFAFNDVISTSNSTSVVMRDVLCCNNTNAKEQWYEYPSFLTIFKKAGYNVFLWDNQRNYDEMATYSFTLNSFIYNQHLLDIFYTQTNKKSYTYDTGIVDCFNNSIDLSNKKHNLVIFHLQGQHVSPSARFPHDEFKHFTADSIKRDEEYITEEIKQYIADYDNATLYNDYVLKQIFEKFKESNTILIYFPDHGEEAYDYRKQSGRDHGEITSQVLKYQYDIPFIVWCSDTYKMKNPDVIKGLQQAINRPFSIDNTCNMLFNIGGISTSWYRDSLDILSPAYKCEYRLIKGEYIYEQLR